MITPRDNNFLTDKEVEAIDGPSHYGGKYNVYEAIKIIDHYKLGFCLGNVIKYILRAGKKDPSKHLEDLKKAAWYLNHEIERLDDANNKTGATRTS